MAPWDPYCVELRAQFGAVPLEDLARFFEVWRCLFRTDKAEHADAVSDCLVGTTVRNVVTMSVIKV